MGEPWLACLSDAPHANVNVRFRVDVFSPFVGGAPHCMDLPYVFGHYSAWIALVPPDPEANEALSQAVMNAWTNFSRWGDPNKGEGAREDKVNEVFNLPHWPALDREDSNATTVMIIDLPLGKSRVQHIRLHDAFPELWKVWQDNVRPVWFHSALPDSDEGLNPQRACFLGCGAPSY